MSWDEKARKACAYDFAEHEMEGFPVRRGDAVSIAGEPGCRRYRVLAAEPSRGMVTVVDEAGATRRVPVSALALERGRA